MPLTTLKELEWIHDCVVTKITYENESEKERSIRLEMECPFDLGYAPWQGKHLILIISGVAASKHIVWVIAGLDSIDSIRPGISEGLRPQMLEAIRAGGRFPSVECTVVFHSGSSLEVVCKGLQIEVKL
jgi:hypothetical protein